MSDLPEPSEEEKRLSEKFTLKTLKEFKPLARPGNQFSVGFRVDATVVARTDNGVLLQFSDEGDFAFYEWEDVDKAMERTRKGECAYYPVYIGYIEPETETRKLVLVRARIPKLESSSGIEDCDDIYLLMDKVEYECFFEDGRIFGKEALNWDIIAVVEIKANELIIDFLKWLLREAALKRL